MASVVRRVMVYLGLVDDDEYEDYEHYPEEPPPQAGSRRPASAPAQSPVYAPEPEPAVGVRTLPPPREPEPAVTVQPRPAVVKPISPVHSARVHVVAPTGFNDAQEIADKLKGTQPVIVNLGGSDRELSRRLIDFCSGVTYGVDGKMERVAEHVFLLTPTNVEVSPDEKRRLQERGLYSS
jgi:cell division inhibitor SepF